MVAPKSKRKELCVPDYVRKEWETGSKTDMAELLLRVNFDKDPSHSCVMLCMYIYN